jgi:hypothetical protein
MYSGLLKAVLIIPIITVLLGAISTTVFAQGNNNGWTLTVNAMGVPSDSSYIRIDVYGPFGSHQTQQININPSTSNLPIPTTFSISGGDIPYHYQYKVCMSNSYSAPACNTYTHGQLHETVSMAFRFLG